MSNNRPEPGQGKGKNKSRNKKKGKKGNTQAQNSSNQATDTRGPSLSHGAAVSHGPVHPGQLQQA